MYAGMSAGTRRTRNRLPGQRKFMTPDRSRSSADLAQLRSTAPELSHGRETDDGTHEVLLGGKLQRVDARAAERRAKHLLALADDGCEASTKFLVVRVDPHVLARLGVIHHDHADLGKLPLARIGESDREHLVPSRQLRERALPAWRGEEVRDDENQRPATHLLHSGLEQLRERGGRRLFEARASFQL